MSAITNNINYPRAPITEAVIALHFEVPPTEKDILLFAKKHKSEFPRSEDILTITGKFDLARRSQDTTFKIEGRKLTSADKLRVLQISKSQMAFSHLAPYTKWEDLYGEARAFWKGLKKIAGGIKVNRVSTRYINRIDIPISSSTSETYVPPEKSVMLGEYFNLGPSLPSRISSMTLESFHVALKFFEPSNKITHVVQLTSTEAPIIDRLSFLLDIDVLTNEPLSQDDEKLWQAIDGLRKYKNDVFEACITEKTRNLFQ